MNLFHPIPDSHAVIRVNHGYKQVPMYYRGANVYVAVGNTFYRLLGHGRTTSPKVMLVDHDATVKEERGNIVMVTLPMGVS